MDGETDKVAAEAERLEERNARAVARTARPHMTQREFFILMLFDSCRSVVRPARAKCRIKRRGSKRFQRPCGLVFKTGQKGGLKLVSARVSEENFPLRLSEG